MNIRRLRKLSLRGPICTRKIGGAENMILMIFKTNLIYPKAGSLILNIDFFIFIL